MVVTAYNVEVTVVLLHRGVWKMWTSLLEDPVASLVHPEILSCILVRDVSTYMSNYNASHSLRTEEVGFEANRSGWVALQVADLHYRRLVGNWIEFDALFRQ